MGNAASGGPSGNGGSSRGAGGGGGAGNEFGSATVFSNGRLAAAETSEFFWFYLGILMVIICNCS